MSTGDQLEIFARLLFAFFLGSVVGLEREFRGHEAGIRTSALVCVGAAAFGEVSRATFADSRIAAGVVQGVGFLGAGLIFQRGEDVRGVTTAATIWLLAAVGLLVSAELWLVATLLVAATVLLLELSFVSDWVYRKGEEIHGKPARPKDRESRRGRGGPAG